MKKNVELNDLEVMRRWQKIWRKNVDDILQIYFLIIFIIGVLAACVYFW